jgi:chromatin remodeling complex protein RSC6
MSSKARRSAKTETVEETPAPAPVVEAAPVEAAPAQEEATETFEAVMTSFREDMSAMASLQKKLNATVKTLERLHAREVKAGGKSKRSAPKKDRAPSGFAKATPVPEALRKFLKLKDDVELPRTEVAKQIYSYVREQNLRDKEDRRIIHPDASLRKLFGLKEGETLDFKNFQKQLSRHYPKSASSSKTEEATEAPAPAKVEAKVEAEATSSKRRSRGATSSA